MEYYKVNIYISAKTDPDLAALSQSGGFSISRAAKAALRAYISHKRIYLPVPNVTQGMIRDKRITISFSYDSDMEVIAFLNSILPGYRGVVIKRIIEYNLAHPVLSHLYGGAPDGGVIIPAEKAAKTHDNKTTNKKQTGAKTSNVSTLKPLPGDGPDTGHNDADNDTKKNDDDIWTLFDNI